LIGVLSVNHVVGSRSGGVEDGIGSESVEQLVQVRVGLEESCLTVVVGGREFGKVDVYGAVRLGRDLSVCSVVSNCLR
jgi:hypothetical protein